MENKGLIVLLIILLTIISIVLLTGMFLMINGKFRFNIFGGHKVSTELIAEEEYENKFKKVDIDTGAADVYIKESDSNKVKVLIYGEKEDTKLEKTDEELKIDIHENKRHFFSFGVEMSKVEVYIPKDYKEKIIIKNAYGNIEIGKFLNAEMEISEDCGDISIQSAKKAQIKNDYGDIKLEEAEEADIKQSAGNVEVGKVKDIQVKNNFGDIKIKEVTNYIEADEDCGEIKIDKVTLNKNSRIKNNFGDVKIGNTNEIFIEAKTDMGDVKINNNYHKSDVSLKIDNDCGDIKVNN